MCASVPIKQWMARNFIPDGVTKSLLRLHRRSVSGKESTVEDFLKANDCEETIEDVMKYIESKREGTF